MSDIGIKLGVEGEKAFNAALKDINSGLKLLNSEMKAVSSQFLDNNKSIEAYTAKNQVLAKQIDAQKDKVEKLKQILEKSTQMYGESDKRTQAWATKLNIAQAELNKMNGQLKNNNTELEKYSSFTTKTADSVGKLDKEMAVLKGELDGVDKKYRKNKDSVEALNEKQRILSDIFGKQSEKVKVLKEALETSKNAFGKGSEETKKFEKALANAEQELKGTETELKKVDNAMQNSSKSTKTFGDMLKANLSAQAISAGIKKLADSAKNLGNYIMGGVKSASSFGREMSAMSEKTGISTVVLQKFSAAAKMTEVDVETFTKSYAKSIKSMNAVDFNAKNLNAMSKAYKTLGVEVRDSSGNLRDAQTVFWETVDGLKNMENETERNAISMQIFGKSAMELNPIIKRGSEGFQDLTKNITTFDDQTMESMRGLDISMQKFGGVMDGIKRSIGVAFAPMMKEIADAAANAGGKLRGLFTAIAKGEDQESINKRFEEFKKSITEFAEKLKEQMPKFIEIGGKILDALFEGLKTAFGPILPQIAAWGLLVAGAFAAWSALIAAAIAAWPVAIGLALAGVIVMFWPQISKFLTDLWNNITKFFEEHWQDMLLWIFAWPAALIKTLNDAGVWEQLGGWLSEIWENIKNSLGCMWDGIKNWFSDLMLGISDWSKDLWNGFIEFLKALPEKIGYWLGFALGSIVKFFIDAWDSVVKFGKDTWDFITVEIPKIIKEVIEWFKKLPGEIWKWLTDTIKNVQNWGKKTGEEVQKTGKNFIDNMIKFFKELPNNIWKWLTEIIDKVKKWAGKMAKKAKDMAIEMSENILKTIKELPDKVYEIGRNIIEGIWKGISGAADWLKGKVKGFCDGFLGGFKKALKIDSPSKLFRDEIGKNLALGIGEGFSDEIGNVVNDMKSALPTSLDYDLNPAVNNGFSTSTVTPFPNDPDYMVTAFQKALKGMAFKIDEDKIGEMVISKVERVVFA